MGSTEKPPYHGQMEKSTQVKMSIDISRRRPVQVAKVKRIPEPRNPETGSEKNNDKSFTGIGGLFHWSYKEEALLAGGHDAAILSHETSRSLRLYLITYPISACFLGFIQGNVRLGQDIGSIIYVVGGIGGNPQAHGNL